MSPVALWDPLWLSRLTTVDLVTRYKQSGDISDDALFRTDTRTRRALPIYPMSKIFEDAMWAISTTDIRSCKRESSLPTNIIWNIYQVSVSCIFESLCPAKIDRGISARLRSVLLVCKVLCISRQSLGLQLGNRLRSVPPCWDECLCIWRSFNWLLEIFHSHSGTFLIEGKGWPSFPCNHLLSRVIVAENACHSIEICFTRSNRLLDRTMIRSPAAICILCRSSSETYIRCDASNSRGSFSLVISKVLLDTCVMISSVFICVFKGEWK